MIVHVESYGCAANKAYGVSLQGELERGGFELSASPDDAELVVVNTCTVKGQTEDRMIERIRQLLGAGKNVVVTGCMATAQPGLVARLVGRDNVIPLEGFHLPHEGPGPSGVGSRSRALPPLPSRPVARKAVVPISRGCLGKCTYCIVRLALGPLRSYGVSTLVSHVDRMVRSGASEIYLTSQDLAAFGSDNGETLLDLIEGISDLDGDFRARLGMMTPNRAAPIFDELLELIAADSRFYRFLHLPLQSGDDGILRLMGRNYSRSGFLSLVRRARQHIPTLNLTTDIIIGFPFEDEGAFRNTLSAVQQASPNKVNISRFTPRPHTVASLLPQVDRRVVNSRSRIAHEGCNEVVRRANEALVGTELTVVPHRDSKGGYSGRAINFLPVRIKAGRELELHTPIEVRIEGATTSGLAASV